MLLLTEVAWHLPVQVMILTRSSYLSIYFFLIGASNERQLDLKLICALARYPVKSTISEGILQTNKQTSKESKEQNGLNKQGLGIAFLVPKLLHGDSWEGTTDHSSHTFVHSTLIKVHASSCHRINIPAGMLSAKYCYLLKTNWIFRGITWDNTTYSSYIEYMEYSTQTIW